MATWCLCPEDLNGELQESNGAPRQGSGLAGAQRYDFHAAGKVLAGAAKRYLDPPSAKHDPTPDLTSRIAPGFMIALGTMSDTLDHGASATAPSTSARAFTTSRQTTHLIGEELAKWYQGTAGVKKGEGK